MNIELIIINDGSKDNTHDVIIDLKKKCEDRFTRFEYINRNNLGLSATLNESLKWSKGKYFSAIASDDVLLNKKISLLTNELELLGDSYAVAFGDAAFINDDSDRIYLNSKGIISSDKLESTNSFLEYYTQNRNFNYREEFGSYKTLLSGNYLPAMSYLIRLDKIKEVSGWTSGNTIEDWEMWLKLSKKNKFIYINEQVALYRWHDNNSCKLLSKNIHYDSILLLKNDREYALNNNLKEIYYESLLNKIIGIKEYSKIAFIFELLKEINNIFFMKIFFKKIIRKIIK